MAVGDRGWDVAAMQFLLARHGFPSGPLDGGFGPRVVIGHRLGVTTMYAHLSSIAVRRGQCVTGHDLVGRVGSTGFSTGPHLHFEARINGAVTNPMNYL